MLHTKNTNISEVILKKSTSDAVGKILKLHIRYRRSSIAQSVCYI